MELYRKLKRRLIVRYFRLSKNGHSSFLLHFNYSLTPF